MKFKSNIEIQAGLEDASGSPGTVNQLLSSTVTGTAWVDPSTIVAEAATLVVIACKNTSGATIAQGTPVYQTGTVGATATIEIAPADALISENKLPAIGLLQTALNNNGFGFVVITGELTNFITSPIDGVVPTTGDKVFVKSGGGLTLTKPTGEGNGIQNMGLVGKVSTGNSGSITVSSIMRTNDVPNLPEGRIWVGDGNTIVSDTVYVDEPNNRVGIGTTNPLQPFQVDAGSSIASFRSVGTGENNKELLIQTGGDRVTLDAKNADDGTATSLSFELGNSEKARLTTTGLGIGTTSPSQKLTIRDDSANVYSTGDASTNTGDLVLQNNDETDDNFNRISFQSNSSNNQTGDLLDAARITAIYADHAGGNPSGELAFETKADPGTMAEAMRIDRDGNVGIGTNSPGSLLHVEGSRTTAVFQANQTGAGVIANFKQGGSSKVLIDNSGNVGIGTTNPLFKLQVQGSVALDVMPTHESEGTVRIGRYDSNTSRYNDIKSYVSSTAASNYLKFAIHGSVENATIDVMTLKGDGNVGIGTTSPQAKLDVDGDIFLASRHVKISSNGANVYFTAATHDASGTEGLLNKLGFKSVGTYFDNNFISITDTSVALPLDTSIVQEARSSGDNGWNVLTLPKESGTFALENWVTSNFAPSTGGSYLPLSAGSGSPLTGDLYMPGFMYHVGDTDSYFGFGAPNVFDLATGGSRKLYADSAALYLYYSGSQKLRTTNTGVTVTGDIQIDSALLSNQENTDIDSAAAEVVAQVAISYTAAFFDFVVKKGTNIRSGTVYACHDGTNVEFTETSTNDLGDTSDVTLSVDKTSTNLRLIATVTSDDWSVKSLIRAI